VTAVVYLSARTVAGVGVVVPGLLPPVVAAAAALLLAGGAAPPVAYVAGVLGTLIGADLLNLHRIGRMRRPWCQSAVRAPSTASCSAVLSQC